ncbi:MAG TPA: phosphoribosylglycinamide formyltransferase [Gemmatimonadaceae bacterium]|nr:phosphoribosylglycinamide formyltransferase [Gemmatimonadaceae bacterium]
MVSIAVLASGSGTNLQAIIDFNAKLGASASGVVSLVASNRASAGALDKARAAGIRAEVFDHSDDGTALLGLLQRHSIDLVVLAGYLKHLPPKVVTAYRARIINIHPGLLPEFGGAGMYGSRVHAAVIAAGSRATGVTVHFVDEEFDHGPTIGQWRIPVRDDDTAESLAARVLEVEHRVYPAIIEMVASLNDKKFFADY